MLLVSRGRPLVAGRTDHDPQGPSIWPPTAKHCASSAATMLPDPRVKPWLTIAEVAKHTGEGEKVIRHAVAAGQLPELRVGRYIRIPTAALWKLCLMEPFIEEAGPASTPCSSSSTVGTGVQSCTKRSGGNR